MKKILEKLEDYRIPFDTGKLALFVSVLALAYVASSANTPCLSASTCAVGSDPVFEDNVGIKGGTAFTATLDASLITNDRNIQLPDTDGTLAVTATLAGNKMLRTNVSGEIEVDSATYPVTLSPDLPLYTSATGEVTAGAFDASILGIGAGLSNQVLAVNGGGNALTWATINGVPSLTANKPLISDGLGALTTANLTADKIMITDTNGNLDTTNVYPLSFSANKPVVTDGAGNLTDITLNANENVVTDGNGNLTTSTLSPDLPVITDGNGNLTASKLDPETDLTIGTGTAGQFVAVDSTASNLEFVDAPTGGQWTLVASGNSKGATGSTSGGTASNDILFCWGGANSTDGVDGSYFRMDNNKRYKIVFAPRNTGQGSSASTGYSGNAIQWLGSNVDCSSGAVNTGNTGATNAYEYSVPSWWYYWNKNPVYNGYSYSNGDSDCKVLDNQTIHVNYMPVSWQGEIIFTQMENYWNNLVYGVKGEWEINFNIMNSQSPYNSEPNAFSKGICSNTTGTTQGGSVGSLSYMYGLLLKDYRPYTWGGQDTWVKYWLYEDNNYSSN